MKLVKIPSGAFLMGQEGLSKKMVMEDGELRELERSDAEPVHEVEISCFYMAEKETTKTQFREYVKAKGFSWERFPQVDPRAEWPKGLGPKNRGMSSATEAQNFLVYAPSDNCPVNNISWKEARDFCEWLSKKEGRRYRLPTEAEWEYGCRAGTRTLFWWGNGFDEDRARGMGESPLIGDKRYRFTPAGHYPPNPWGLYDTHGNVHEWVSDWFDPTYYARSPRKDPQGPTFGSIKIMRGGGASDYTNEQLSAAVRHPMRLGHWKGVGFRIACDAASVATILPDKAAGAQPSAPATMPRVSFLSMRGFSCVSSWPNVEVFR